MKWKRRPPLLAAQEPPTYVMDTSAWLNIDGQPNRDRAWLVVVTLIEAGRLLAPMEVIEEVKVNEDVWAKIQTYEDALKSAARSGDAYLLRAGAIGLAHQGIAGIRSQRTKADPFVVALAELEKFTVVTDETKSKRPNRKIPGVCDKRGVKWVCLAEMLSVEATELGIK